MKKKLKVSINFIHNIACEYPDRGQSEGEDLTVKEVIYFVFDFVERIDVLLFQSLAIFF